MSLLFCQASVSYTGLMKLDIASAAWAGGAGGSFWPSLLIFPGVELLSWSSVSLGWLLGMALHNCFTQVVCYPLVTSTPP